jgi:hypothetical protein
MAAKIFRTSSGDSLSRPHRQFTLTASCTVFAAIILAHAALLPLSRWQGDEYANFDLLRQQGWSFVVFRLLHWAARPWSEAWLMLYGVAANAAHRPLAGRFDALLWAALAAACLVPAWFGAETRRDDAGRRGIRLAFGLALFALFLLGHSICEVFLWPAGAAAYLPTLAGACWLFWCVADGLPGHRAGAAAALLLAAGSSEVGIFLVLIFAAGITLAGRDRRTGLLWLLPALLVALTDLWVLLHTRIGTIEILGPESVYVHHVWPSLRAAAPGFFLDLVSSGADMPTTTDIASHVAADILVLIGARWCLASARPEPARQRALFAFCASLLIACYATRAAAFYQFGELCCERHEIMRQCLILLALAAAGAGSAARWPPRIARGAFCLSPLLAATILLAVPRAPDLLQAYRLAPRSIAARAQTWESGERPGDGAMTMVLTPPGRLLHGLGGFDPGTYRLGKDTPWHLRGVMQYFGKQSLTIVVSPG